MIQYSSSALEQHIHLRFSGKLEWVASADEHLMAPRQAVLVVEVTL